MLMGIDHGQCADIAAEFLINVLQMLHTIPSCVFILRRTSPEINHFLLKQQLRIAEKNN